MYRMVAILSIAWGAAVHEETAVGGPSCDDGYSLVGGRVDVYHFKILHREFVFAHTNVVSQHHRSLSPYSGKQRRSCTSARWGEERHRRRIRCIGAWQQSKRVGVGEGRWRGRRRHTPASRLHGVKPPSRLHGFTASDSLWPLVAGTLKKAMREIRKIQNMQ